MLTDGTHGGAVGGLFNLFLNLFDLPGLEDWMSGSIMRMFLIKHSDPTWREKEQVCFCTSLFGVLDKLRVYVFIGAGGQDAFRENN